jgi:phosphoribosylanthranilate isomerase
MAKIKICGITNKEDAMWVANLAADYLGMVFAKESKRNISEKAALEIIEAIPPYMQKVGLFVNEEPKTVDKIITKCKLDLVQFHGEESADYCREFKGRVKVIKAFRVKDQESLMAIPQYDVDFYLLDAFVDEERGGTGATFDWDLALKAKEFGKPLFLAGGLNAENVTEAIKKVQPYAVDVSSGVEASPRRKNIDLMLEFIKKVEKAG